MTMTSMIATARPASYSGLVAASGIALAAFTLDAPANARTIRAGRGEQGSRGAVVSLRREGRRSHS